MMKQLAIMMLTVWLAAAQQTPDQIYITAPEKFPYLTYTQGLYEITPNGDLQGALALIVNYDVLTVGGNKNCFCYESDSGMEAAATETHCPGATETGLKFGVVCVMTAEHKITSMELSDVSGTMKSGTTFDSNLAVGEISHIGLYVSSDGKTSVAYRKGPSSYNLPGNQPQLKRVKRHLLGYAYSDQLANNATLETSVVLLSGEMNILAYHSKYFGPLVDGVLAEKPENWATQTAKLLPSPAVPNTQCVHDCHCDVETTIPQQAEPPALSAAGAAVFSAALMAAGLWSLSL